MLFLGKEPRGENPSIPGNKSSLPRECESLRAHLFPRRVNSSDTAVNASGAKPGAESPLPQDSSPDQGVGDPPGRSGGGFWETPNRGCSCPRPRVPRLCWWPRGGSVTSLEVTGLRPSCLWRGHGRLIQLFQIIPSLKKNSPRAAGTRRWRKGHKPEGGRATHTNHCPCFCVPKHRDRGGSNLPQRRGVATKPQSYRGKGSAPTLGQHRAPDAPRTCNAP